MESNKSKTWLRKIDTFQPLVMSFRQITLFLYLLTLQVLCIRQFHLRPAPPPLPADPRALAFFLPWMANSRGWGLLSSQIPWGGDEKRRLMPSPPSTLQHFLLITQSTSAILSILMCEFLFQLTSSFVIVLGF